MMRSRLNRVPQKTTLPDFYNDASKVLSEAFRMLTEAVCDRNAPFHTPAVSTNGGDGGPQVRTVVLRGFDAETRLLRFHTDIRSRKIVEIGRDERVAMLFQDPRAKVQLRVSGRARIHRADRIADDAWAGTRPAGRQCYRVTEGPGTVLPAPDGFAFADAGSDGDGGRDVFCVVAVGIETLDWYYLSHLGHRRLAFDWRGSSMRHTWLVP